MGENNWWHNSSWVIREGFPEEVALKLRPEGVEETSHRGFRQREEQSRSEALRWERMWLV